MRVEDAPPAGWYPDPEGGSRLRWWEGTDWADRWRAPPTPGVVEIRSGEHEDVDDALHSLQVPTPGYSYRGGMSRADSEAIISQVREAAREEVDRAAEMFGRQARSATENIGPLITQYTNRFTRWFRFVFIVLAAVFVAWLAFQLFAQASLFEWIGDRIDNLTDNIGDDQSGLGAWLVSGRPT